jgi:hypothetical protein
MKGPSPSGARVPTGLARKARILGGADRRDLDSSLGGNRRGRRLIGYNGLVASSKFVPDRRGETRRLFAKDSIAPPRWDVCNLVEMIGYATESAKKEAAYRSQSGNAREDGQKRGRRRPTSVFPPTQIASGTAPGAVCLLQYARRPATA